VLCAGLCFVVDSGRPLADRSVLIVEDEALIALDVHQILSEAGASVIAATSLRDALELIAYADIEIAVLDVSLGRDDCSPACAALQKRAIPFMFYTGHETGAALHQWHDAPTLMKPALPASIVDALSQLIASRATGGSRNERHLTA
jgi:DNA-binding response OmpR family regulator